MSEVKKSEKPQGIPNAVENEIVYSYCNVCRHDTKHIVVAVRDTKVLQKCDFWSIGDDSGPFEISWGFDYSVLECCGCEDISLKKVSWFSEHPDPDDWEINYYPPRISRHIPLWTDRLPHEYKDLLKEVYTSLHINNRFLSAMGARALIDLFISRKVGDCGNFILGLRALVEKGYITNRSKVIIESAIEAGHAASHRAYRPTDDQLNSVMDIIENLIQQDLLEDSAKTLRKTIPKRKNKIVRK